MIETYSERQARNGADVAVYGPDGNLQLIVQAKGQVGAGPLWAAEYRRNLLVHGLVPNAPFFLMALPDHFYLWRDAPATVDPVMPHYDIDPAPLLAPYMDDAVRLSGKISESGFLFVVIACIRHLVTFSVTIVGAEGEAWLVDSGLGAAIRGGTVVS